MPVCAGRETRIEGVMRESMERVRGDFYHGKGGRSINK